MSCDTEDEFYGGFKSMMSWRSEVAVLLPDGTYVIETITTDNGVTESIENAVRLRYVGRQIVAVKLLKSKEVYIV